MYSIEKIDYNEETIIDDTLYKDLPTLNKELDKLTKDPDIIEAYIYNTVTKKTHHINLEGE